MLFFPDSYDWRDKVFTLFWYIIFALMFALPCVAVGALFAYYF